MGVTRGGDFHLSRDLFALPSGPLGLALGVEGRKEALNFSPTALGIASDEGFTSASAGTRSAEAAFVELSIPILKNFDAQLALREDHYSDFGSTLNPKYALRWQPIRALLFRASYGRGFRAPSLPELFTAQTTGVDVVQDNVRCPNGIGADADCEAIIRIRSGGNPTSLKPERSEQSSAGIVFEPSHYFSASVDYYKIRLSNQIGTLDLNYVLDNDATFEGRNIFRGPADPATPGLPGPIVELDLLNQNIGAIRTHGLDVQLAVHSDPTPIGRFDASLAGTFTQEAESQGGTPGFIRARAIYTGGFVIPRWQQYLSLDWKYADWTATVNESLQTGYQETSDLPATAGLTRHVGNYENWGAQLTYAGVRNLKLTVGLDNVFDRAPPFTFQNDFQQTGYNPAIANPRGRFWYAKIATHFP